MLRVQRGVCKDNSWRILRRYNEFAVLHKELQISGIELPLPGKKIVGKSLFCFWVSRHDHSSSVLTLSVRVHLILVIHIWVC